MILHIEFCSPPLCGIAKNTQGEILLCEISGYDKFDKMSLNDLTLCGHTAKYTIKVLKKQIRQKRNGSLETNTSCCNLSTKNKYNTI